MLSSDNAFSKDRASSDITYNILIFISLNFQDNIGAQLFVRNYAQKSC